MRSAARRRDAPRLAVLLLVVTALLGLDLGPPSPLRPGPPVGQAATSVLTRVPWPSGVWTGSGVSAELVGGFETWRGSRVDTVTTYPAYGTWRDIATSDYHVSTFEGFRGRLVYGLPLLPSSEPATLGAVAAGRHDSVFRAVAASLLRHGRGDSYVRIGLEANGTWFRWHGSAATAATFRAAFRRVAGVLTRDAPGLQIVFDITCGAGLSGSPDRLAPLSRLYPGDDVVDVVGCDHYDSHGTRSSGPAQFAAAAAPDQGAGLRDVVAFARQHGKRFAVPEWGLVKRASCGNGDNPAFVRSMHAFFAAHRDVLAFENYFNEADPYIRSALWRSSDNPASASLYRRLWRGGLPAAEAISAARGLPATVPARTPRACP